MIRGDEPWLGRNVLSQSPIQAAAVVVAPVISVQTAKRSAITLSVVGRRQQVPTGPKVRRDAAERRQEPLRVPDRHEAFHRPLALPGRLVGVLGAVVQVLRPPMLHRRHELAVRHLLAGELVGDDHPGHVPQAREQSAEELLCGHRVWARPHQNVEHVGVLVDRAPPVPLCAVVIWGLNGVCTTVPISSGVNDRAVIGNGAVAVCSRLRVDSAVELARSSP